MKILLVINPVAGENDKQAFRKKAEALFRYYGIRAQFFETSGKNDLEALRERIKAFYPDKVAAAGGDGTMMLVSQALRDTDIPVGIIPLGSANGMAFELSVKTNPLEALKDILMSNLVKYLDRPVINGQHPFLHLADVGVNARMIEAYQKSGKHGMVAYAKAFLAELGNFDSFEYRIKTAEKEYTGTAEMMAFCNARHFGTGIPLNTVSDPFDGVFEIVIIKNINASVILKSGLAYFDKSFAKNRHSEIIRCTKAQIYFLEERLLQADGELIGRFNDLKIEMHEAAVPLLLTEDYKNRIEN